MAPTPPALPHAQASINTRAVRRDLCRRRLHFPHCWWLLVGLLTLDWLSQAVAAAECPEVGLERPDVTTIYRSPIKPSEAVLLRSDCTFKIVPITRNSDIPEDPYRVLDFSGMGAEHIHDYPPGAQILALGTNFVREADLSNDFDMRHLIVCWSQLTDIDRFVLPPKLEGIDLLGNALRFLDGSKFPNTTTLMYLNLNKLQNLDKFNFPTTLLKLYLDENALTTVRNITFPPALQYLSLNLNPITDLDYVELPDSLQTLACSGCGIKSIVGFKLPSQLQNLNLTWSLVDKFELRKSDLDIFRGLKLRNITSRQSEPCSDPEATFQLVDEIPICVISDSRFDEKFQLRITPAPAPLTTPTAQPNTTEPVDKTESPKHNSPGVATIVVAAVVPLVVVSGLALVCYRRRQTRQPKSEPFVDNEVTATATHSANGVGGTLDFAMDPEYLTNDVRIDECMLVHRLPYEEVHIVREIAKGGYGVVYLAQYRGDNVVVKRAVNDKSRDKVIVQRFMDEIRMCARLDHPKIAQFIGIVWTTLGDLALVIEYMDRGDLCTLLRNQHQVVNGSSWFEASDYLPAKRSLALDVVEALVYLHSFENPIIHRDLKSRNVLLDNQGTAKISDFGISREQALDETMTGEVGTVAWIAPEVLKGGRYGESADIYSFGIFMVELDKCSHPYDEAIKLPTLGNAGATNTRLAVLISTGVLRPKVSGDCPSSVQELVKRCLSQDPAERPSAVQLHFALRKL